MWLMQARSSRLTFGPMPRKPSPDARATATIVRATPARIASARAGLASARNMASVSSAYS